MRIRTHVQLLAPLKKLHILRSSFLAFNPYYGGAPRFVTGARHIFFASGQNISAPDGPDFTLPGRRARPPDSPIPGSCKEDDRPMVRRFGKPDPYDNEMEAAEEFMPDPFSEEPHSFLHKKRARIVQNALNQEKKPENGQ